MLWSSTQASAIQTVFTTLKSDLTWKLIYEIPDREPADVISAGSRSGIILCMFCLMWFME